MFLAAATSTHVPICPEAVDRVLAEVALPLAFASGARAAATLAAASRVLAPALRDALVTLRRSDTLAPLHGDGYVFGGHGGGRGPVSTCHSLKLVAGSRWQLVPPMPTPRVNCAAAALGGAVYVVGGNDGRRELGDATRLDLARGRWDELLPMPTRRSRCSAASDGRAVYVIGGWNDCASALCAAECLDPGVSGSEQRASWAELPPMEVCRAGCAAAFVPGAGVCVAGGWRRGRVLASAEALDLAKRCWRRLPDMPSARSRCAAACVQGQLVVVGGSSGAGELDAIEAFRPCQNAWERWPSLGMHRAACAAASASQALYVVGGVDVDRPGLHGECHWPPGGERRGVREACADGLARLPALPSALSGCAAVAAWP
ncbi:unnamed protein product [Prorocentrum cordatum]|uniref:Uncharacterized protein n=1 Tax=Prorocentrum cordatum TaxID=2364126 RepID=A0ABN9XSR7_9DINO|nr:unnamed protein product [Polarella glacialis]